MNAIEQYKQQATNLEIELANNGSPIRRCEALEQVAKRAGFESWRALIASKPNSAKMSLGQSSERLETSTNSTEDKSEPTKYILRRKGAPPLRFVGRILADYVPPGRFNDGWEEYYAIYLTQGGKYIPYRYSGHNSRPASEDMEDAESLSSPQDVVDWFRDDSGRIGYCYQMLLELAANCDAGIKKAYIENIE